MSSRYEIHVTCDHCGTSESYFDFWEAPYPRFTMEQPSRQRSQLDLCSGCRTELLTFLGKDETGETLPK